jgi:hypothetical protein
MQQHGSSYKRKKFEYDERICKSILEIPTGFKWLTKYNYERPVDLSIVHIKKVVDDIQGRIHNKEDKINITDAFIYILKLAKHRNHFQRLNLFEYMQEEIRKWIETRKKFPETVAKYLRKSVQSHLDQSLDKETREIYRKMKGDYRENN